MRLKKAFAISKIAQLAEVIGKEFRGDGENRQPEAGPPRAETPRWLSSACFHGGDDGTRTHVQIYIFQNILQA